LVLLFIVILLSYTISVLTLAMTLAAVSELVIELRHGEYTLDTLITASLLVAATLSSIRAKVETKREPEAAIGASIGLFIITLILFASVYALPLFDIHPPERFMAIYGTIFPIWIALNVVTIVLALITLYIASKL